MIIKVCGLREADNIRAVEAAGADWVGFIFYERSPRYVSEVPSYLPERALRVGVFVSPRYGEVMQHVEDYGLQAVQLHGEATPELCRKLRERGLIVIRVIPADERLSKRTGLYLNCVDYFLFDTPTMMHGGSGRTFNWSLLEAYTGSVPFLLSGGIGPDCVEALREFHHPRWVGIDLNSRFEKAAALKDTTLIKQFIQALSL